MFYFYRAATRDIELAIPSVRTSVHVRLYVCRSVHTGL